MCDTIKCKCGKDVDVETASKGYWIEDYDQPNILRCHVYCPECGRIPKTIEITLNDLSKLLIQKGFFK